MNFNLLIVLFIIKIKIVSSDTSEQFGSVTLRKCGDFRDHRVNPPNIDSSIIYIPANLSSPGYLHNEPLYFKLTTSTSNSSILDCPINNTYIHRVPWKVGFLQTSPEDHGFHSTSSWRRNYNNVTTAQLPLPLHFTTNGQFFAGQIYHRPDGGFCVKSISPSGELELRVCKIRCVRTPASGLPPDSYCLPKCCGFDEVLHFWKNQCVKIQNQSANFSWKPQMFSMMGDDQPLAAEASSENLFRPQFYLRRLPEKCNEEATAMGIPFVAKWSSKRVEHPTNPKVPPQINDHIRLTLSPEDGKVYPMLLDIRSRTWKVEKEIPFCAEAFQVGKSKPEIPPDQFVVYHCGLDGSALYASEVDTSRQKISLTYVVISAVSVLFLLATVLVYAVLWDKQSVHGWSILAYSVAQLGGYVFLIVAHIIFLLPNPEITGLFRRGWICYLVAVLAHYFYIASYFWLTILNFDLWMTFRSLRIVSKDPRDKLKFRLYSLFAWGMPLLLIIAFIAVDEVYRDPITRTPVPDYAISTCFVSPNFRGYYVYGPVSVFIILNLLLLLCTMKIFLDARTESRTVFVVTPDTNGAHVKAGKYSVKLFLKLFVLMGGFSVIDFLTWWYNDSDDKPWFIVTLQAIAYLIPVVQFILLCVNRRIGKLLLERFPAIKNRISRK